MTLGNFCSRQICMGGVGFLLVIMGLMFGMFWTEIFTYMFGKEAALTPTSKTYEGWKTPPFPLSFDIYFFNWTNPEDIYNHSTKPILEQMGPYRFTERPDKVDIVFHPENHTVSYKRKSDFWFDEEGSVGSLEDEVTILNAVAISAAAKSKYWGFLRQKGVDVGLKIYNQPLAVTKTVDELLFTGYEDDMITIARDMPIFGDDVEVPFDRFGWFYTRNGSADLTGTYNVFTGTDDISKIGKIHEWNFKKHSGFFKDHCGQINGSAGEFYPPNLQDVDSISMFSADLCRSIDFDFEKAQEIDGILGFKYAAGKRSVDNGTEYPEMKCFCGDECVPSGVMNISSCRFGTPVFMSYPHFYGADEFYLNQVEGLSPDESKHQFYMTLEPNTGVPLEVAARLQLNMLVEEFPNIGLYKGVKKTFLPLLWFEQKVRIPEELASELQIVPTVITIGHIAAGVIFAMGFIMLCWLPTESYIRRRNVLKPTTTLHQSKAPHSHIKSLDPETGAEMKKSPEVSPLIETSAVKMVPMKQPEYCDENTAQKS